MSVKDLLKAVNLKGGVIESMDSNLIMGTLDLNVTSRLYDVDPEYRKGISSQCKEVTVKITFSGIKYVCVDFEGEKGRVVLGIELGNLDKDEIIMIKTFNAESDVEEYNELYIRGNKIDADFKIVKKIAKLEPS